MGKGISQRAANLQKGGFLSDDDIEIQDAIYKLDSFEVDKDGGKEVVERTVASLEILLEGKEEPFNFTWALGSTLVPSEDGETPADEGPYLVVAEGKTSKGVSEQSAWGKFQAALAVKCKFPDANWDAGIRKALSGLRGHTTAVPGGVYKGQKGKDVPVFASIEADSIPSVKVGKAEKAAPAKKGKKAAEPEPEETDEESVEVQAQAIIVKKVAKAPLTKAQLATVMNAKFTDEGEKKEAVGLAINDKFLKAGAKAGLWAYDGRTVSAAEVEEAEEEENDE